MKIQLNKKAASFVKKMAKKHGYSSSTFFVNTTLEGMSMCLNKELTIDVDSLNSAIESLIEKENKKRAPHERNFTRSNEISSL